MVQGGERIMIVESLEGGNEKERKIVQGVKGRNKKRKDCSRVKRRNKKKRKRGLERKKKGRRKGEGRKKEREKRKTVQWLEIRNKKKDALERTSLNGYDE